MFIAMACYEGESLKDIIERGPLTIDQAIDIANQILSGLVQAHAKEIIHRDIKPANILITNDHQVKIVDFGLAKLAGKTLLTKEGTTLGTVSYMSPEQTQGTEVDHRTDLWALGVVLFEMLTGDRPFKGDYEQAVVYSILNDAPVSIKKLNPNIPPELQRIVSRSLQKDPNSRYSSAMDMLKDLQEYQDRLRTTDTGTFSMQSIIRIMRNPKIAIPAAAILVIIIITAIWFFNRQAKLRWAHDEAIPKIMQSVETNWRDYTDAYKLAVQAEEIIPDDPTLKSIFAQISLYLNIKTEPAGAKVFVKEYKYPENEWQYLGVSPLDSIRFPIGIFRWKLEKEGYQTVLAASSTWDINVVGKNLLIPNDFVRILDKRDSIPEGMVRVAGKATPLGILSDFFIDRYEVTNAQFKEFMKSGGYQNKEYWEHPFIEDGKTLKWEEAVTKFVDQTGRPGPATWQAGDYPEGQMNYPVSGISWYEAAAYALFVGKSLPTIQHWGLARGEFTPLIQWPQLGGFATFAPFSNFSFKGPVQVGNLPGYTTFGAFDMAGNVREWCWNEAPAGRVIRGGGWNDNTYRFGELASASPLDRSDTNGFRCALYPDSATLPEIVLGPVNFAKPIDFTQLEPVSDEIFQIYKNQFLYDKTALNAQVDSRDESAKDWIHERITFNAAYADEKMIVNMFLPKNATPPYQTVIYFPGSASIFQSSSEDLTNYYEFPIFLSFLLKNGHAVVYPVYKGTFERRSDALIPIFINDNSHRYTEYIIQVSQRFEEKY